MLLFPFTRPFLLLLLFVGSQHKLLAQLMQVQPEHITDSDLVLENPATLLAAQGITRTQSFICDTGHCTDKQWELQYDVTYDVQGYPVVFRNGTAVEAEVHDKDDTAERFGSRWKEACIFRFRYGVGHELIAVEKSSWDDDHSRTEELVENTYDAQGRLITQQHIRHTLNRPGSTYRGIAYPNDTSIITLVFSYDPQGLATCIRRSADRPRTDTLFTAAVMDTILFAPDTGYVADHITEQRIPIEHALLLDGTCMPQYGPHSPTLRSTYSHGRLSTTETVGPTGEVVSRTVFRYAENGSLVAVEDEEGDRLRYLVHTTWNTR